MLENVSSKDSRINTFAVTEMFKLHPTTVHLNGCKIDKNANSYTLYPVRGGIDGKHPLLVTGKSKSGRKSDSDYESGLLMTLLNFLGWKLKYP